MGMLHDATIAHEMIKILEAAWACHFHTSITVELIRSRIISISRSLRFPRKIATTAFCKHIAHAKPKFPMTATDIFDVERYTHAG